MRDWPLTFAQLCHLDKRDRHRRMLDVEISRECRAKCLHDQRLECAVERSDDIVRTLPPSNFASGLPFWCVSIALAIDQRVILGVIRDPLRDYHGHRRGGAQRLETGERLAMRRLRRSDDAVVVADPGSADDDEAHLRILRLRPHVRAERALGSIALSLTSMAMARLDGVLQVRGLQAVDVAAAGLIALEAGAHVTDAENGARRHPAFAGHRDRGRSTRPSPPARCA